MYLVNSAEISGSLIYWETRSPSVLNPLRSYSFMTVERSSHPRGVTKDVPSTVRSTLRRFPGFTCR